MGDGAQGRGGRMAGWLRRWRPEELLLLVFLVLLTGAVSWVSGHPDLATSGRPRTLAEALQRVASGFVGVGTSADFVFYLVLGILLSTVLLLAGVLRSFERRGPAGDPDDVHPMRRAGRATIGVLRDFAPFAYCFAVYAVLRDLVSFLSPQLYDKPLAQFDVWVFGVRPWVWVREALQHEPGAAILQVGYMSYYAAVCVGLVALAIREHRRCGPNTAFFGFAAWLGLLALAYGLRWATYGVRLNAFGLQAAWQRPVIGAFPPGYAGFARSYLQAAYQSHFWAAPLVALGMYVTCEYGRFRRFLLAVNLTSLFACIGYILVPVVGPRYAFAEVGLAVPAIDWLDHYHYAGHGFTRDCFPSLHTAWAVLTLAYAWSFRRPLFWLYLPLAIGVEAATLYFALHYVSDLVAGVVVAGAGILLARAVLRFWCRHVRDLAHEQPIDNRFHGPLFGYRPTP